MKPLTRDQRRFYPPTTIDGGADVDDMEQYATGVEVDGLNGGLWWALTPHKRHRRFPVNGGMGGGSSPYVDNYPGIGLGAGDDMESYTRQEWKSTGSERRADHVFYLFWGGHARTPATVFAGARDEAMESYTGDGGT